MRALLSLSLIAIALPAGADSYYSHRLEDSSAVYLERPAFAVAADGVADDTAALQQAIDKVQESRGQGIVFIPEGRYRLTGTVHIWPGIRLIGFGANRPVFLLAPNTPGFDDPARERFLLFFAGARRRNQPVADANPGTFYSAASNIDIEIGEANPGASAVRSRYAQHCFLAHMTIRLRSGIAAIHEAGNVVEDVTFIGGRYGVWTGTPSPSWQFTMVDARFEGQTEAAIRERQAGLTLIRPSFRNVPAAIVIDDGFPDELWIKDGRMESITGPAVVIGAEKALRTEINMENVVCRDVPVFALLRESGRKFPAPAPIYDVQRFSHGLHYTNLRDVGQLRSSFSATALPAMPPPVASDLIDLPARESWVNLRSLGAKGDGRSDDTAVLRQAIASYRAIYLPQGNYVVSDTIVLKPDTVLIGLHPNTTQIDLLDGTPAFQGPGAGKAVLETPSGGANIMIGIGVYTNGINPRAIGVKWMAGTRSLMNDVRFLGGHGTTRPDGTRENPYNNNHTADPELRRRWDGQYPSLWVTNGGGGTFFDIWTPSTFAQSGLLVSNTATEGRIYHISSEHHVRYEAQFRNASNWHVYALQTEAERGESGSMLPLEIENCSDITVANLHVYRVISSYEPFPYAVKVSGSRRIHFRNIHVYSNSKVSYDAAVFDQDSGAELRQREFAWLDLPGASQSAPPAPQPNVGKLATGFHNISGGAVSPAGDYYFVDARRQRVLRWSARDRQLRTVSDAPIDAVNLAFDKAGNLLVVSYAGNGVVYWLDPAAPNPEPSPIAAQPAAPRPGLTPVLPTAGYHLRLPAEPRPHHYLSPDRTTYISAEQAFVDGTLNWGVKLTPMLRSFGLAAATPGRPFYLTDEAEHRTYRVQVDSSGAITQHELFAERGGEAVAADSAGNVYIAAGDIHVYSPQGRWLRVIRVPERPLHLAFGGPGGRTLFVAARTSLYSLIP